MKAVTIRQLEENREERESPQEQKQEPMKQEDQENKGPQKINPMEFLTQEDEGAQENYELEFLRAEEPTTLEIDTMDILEQLEERTGPPTVHIRKTNVSMELAANENLAKQEKPLKEQVSWEPHNYLSVFGFPELRPWDYTIDLKPDFVPSLSPISTGTTGIGNICKGQPCKRLHLTLKVTNGIHLLLH